MTTFTSHSFKLKKGDQIYLFTDGYADQFGGPKGKKIGYKQFRELLVRNHSKSMEEQKSNLSSTFSSWIDQGEDEQVDDVCVIGMRI